ncbi:bifunctional diaminohydroxyphosphoribosylaminopyrimidine deaminase/5-amino-6-(5-phosphoribosylamino)uracil reductase RibD [Pikeienuella piscinae]|uniref:Riboflavin biosynthesis protein RibD n=2 Tax=Pikeienuella piscinae TaxID=2748098 RepID=A0A7M3T6V9_9RHOB|nr:bifunctional diaminohydroxyphosphoribosylaminopyrimidine deaminase/5-amino-6-(5-phosphoribosylamino)uracil reductase RibD [Pikeienuella piscinae]
MAAAIALARRGVGRVWPNPAVGCVIVSGGRVVGRGWTQPGGRPHAEAMALAAAESLSPGAARGATVYVSLEPCAHFGRTPPCADALIAAGVARVVAPMEDPDPRVSGGGFARLRAAGLAVETGLMAAEAASVNAGFLMRQRARRPFLTLKLAATLDGRIATASGESRWITGPAARARVHLLRARNDGVLVGAATARADDPALDIRIPGLQDHAPLRLVIDAALTLPPTLKLAAPSQAAMAWRLHDRNIAGAAADWGEPVAIAPGTDGRLDLHDMMAVLGARGLTRVLCEGGGRLGAALLRAGLVDEMVWFSAGAAIGAEGAPALGPLGLAHLAGAPRFDPVHHERLGKDLMSVWRPRRET